MSAIEARQRLLSLMSSLLQTRISDEVFSYKEFIEFMTSERITFLKICYLPNSNKVILITNSEAKEINEKDKCIIFYKNQPCPLKYDEFFTNCDIVFGQDSFSTRLNNEIDANILAYLGNISNDNNLKSYLKNFKERIIAIEKKLRKEKIRTNAITEEDYSLIISPEEEIEFWKEYSYLKKGDTRVAAILDCFSKVEKYYLPSYEIDPMKSSELFTQIFGCIEDIIQNIKPKVNVERLKHFLSLSLDYFSNQILIKVGLLDKEGTPEALIIILEAQNGLNFCQERVNLLNKIYFTKKPYCLEGSLCEKAIKKVKEILEVKKLIKDVNKLMPEIKLQSITETINKDGSNEDSLKLIDSSLEKVSKDIITKLNENVFDSGNHVIMSLRDLNNWKDVLNRLAFRSTTAEKRNKLLADLNKYLNELSQIYENKQKNASNLLGEENEDRLSEKNIIGVSPPISMIISLHALKQKCQNCISLSMNVLNDLKDYQNLNKNAENLIKKIDTFIEEIIGEWNSSYMGIKEEIPRIGTDLVEIDKKTGFLKVNFSEKLFQLIQDARLLTEYGYQNKIDNELIKANEEGKKILKNAISMKQTANFYNSLSTQVIPSQKPMLVKCAKEFESNLVYATQKYKSREGKIDLENYVHMIQTAGNNLNEEIKTLKKAHNGILDLLCQLFNYDLISTKYKWRELLQKARDIYSEVSKNYDKNLITEWKKHWNFQLFKILKIQYSVSLNKFYSFVTEVPCEFIIKHRMLELNPPIEEVKKSIYKEITKFLSIPNEIYNFITDEDENEPSYYHLIVDENSSQITKLYEQLNVSITQLNELKKKLSEIVGIAYLDFEPYIEKNFTVIEDWKYNYDLIKQKRREIEKLPNIIKIDCFKINVATYKTFADDSFEKIFDSLASTLKQYLQRTSRIVDDFVKDSMEKMFKKASNFQEVLDRKKNFIELSKKRFEFKKKCKECEDMNRLLIELSGQSMNLSGLNNRWQNFDNEMNKFSDTLEEQKKNIKNEQDAKLKELLSNLEKFYSKYTASIPPDNFVPDKNTDIGAVAKEVKDIYNNWDTIDKNFTDIIEEMKNFELPIDVDLSNYQKIKENVEKNKSKWDLLFDFNDGLENLSKEEWLGIRHKSFGMLQDFIFTWTDKTKKMDKNFIYFHISKQLDSFKQSLPVYKYLIGDNFERDHWKALFNMLGFDNKITKENLKFGNFIEKTENLIETQNNIKELFQRAQGEILIRNAMSELTAWFETAEFHFTENINQTNKRKTPLIKDWKELISDISDKQALLVSVKTSEYFSRFEEQINQYETKFSNLDEWLTNLNLIQRKWVYLDPIFSRGALPSEQSRFKKIDDEFRNILSTLFTNKRVATIFSIIGIQNTLNMLIDQLEKCQKALNDFLEDKRNKFARLYFIGDDDLLEFLANCKDRAVIKNNLNKLYQGITQLNITDNNEITDIIAGNGETVKLQNKVAIGDELEKWLRDLTNEMNKTLGHLFNTTLNEYVKKAIEFSYLDLYPCQICMLIEMVKFYFYTEKYIKNNNIKAVNENCKNLIQNLTVIQAKSGTDNIKLFKIKNLMLDLIHNREVSEKLFEANVSENTHWLWFSQLKYLVKNKELFISMCDGTFTYTYEYQGSGQKLVHTPLTDKCYLTLTQSLRLGYGGNPYGPAGTGKTESVKALGQAFGRQVLVFNCDEGIDFKAMGRIFIGLVKSGAWGCFDEFNRLLEEQLSAISIQIQIIQFALKNKKDTIDLLNLKVKVDFNSAIFVTMNPAAKGYGGRSKLPDNLKILFRPVAMSVPDNLQIAQTLLYAEGFKNGDILSKKVTTLFTLCKQGLSYQQHYDWGLRSLKTILTVASQQIQLFINEGKLATYEEETSILIKAIRINVLSKLTFADAQIFNLLIQDVFPGIDMSDIVYENLNKALMESYKDLHYEFIDSQFKKVVQFYEACRQRMGVVIVGPSGCGKSAIWKLLEDAFHKLNQKIVVHIINPKAMDRKLLLGYMNHDTGEFNYGVLTKCAREIEKEPSDVKCWIICDGDVDPEWIEALNSVLDDNRLMTMQNGERIHFGNNVNFIFETDSLKFASPATVSRMGIIYMNQEDLDINSIYNSWINKTLPEKGEVIQTWFSNYFEEIYKNYRENYKLQLDTTNYGSINNFLSIFAQIFKDPNVNPSTISKIGFADAIIKGLGDNLTIDDRKKFAMYVYQVCGERASNMNNILDVCYNQKKQNLDNYEYQQSENEITDIKQFMNGYPLIKTTSAQCDLDTLKIWLNNNEPFIVVGPEGAGKSLLITHLISQIRSCQMVTLNCTSQTSSTHIIQKLIQNCTMSNTSKGKCLRPRDCSKLILFLKDINLPKPDKYNTIRLIAFLQNIVAYQGFYDENLEFVYLERIQIVASMNPSSTVGRFEITTRFTGNVRMLFLDYPSDEDMNLIYTEYLKGILSSENLGKLSKLSQLLANCSLSIYNNIKKTFTFDMYHHYIFTPRDISNWLIGLLRYECKSADELIKVWGYECIRIFKDKLVGKESKQKFDQILMDELTKISGKISLKEKIDTQTLKSTIYTSLNSTNNSLVELKSDDYKDLLNKGQLIYERENDELYMTYFDENLQNCKIIDRIITKDYNNLLLIGTYGIGRKKSVRVVSSFKNYELYSLNLTKGYSIKDFKKNIKDLFNIVVLENRVTVFIIEIYHIVIPEIMEYINSLLCSGEVPSLLNKEEQEVFLGQIASEFKEQNEYKTLYDFYTHRIRKNLKICILLDYDDKEFNNIILNNPAIVTHCNVVWFNKPTNRYLSEIINEQLRSSFVAMIKNSLVEKTEIKVYVQALVDFYNICSNENVVVSLGKFVQFLLVFKNLISNKLTNTLEEKKHLQSGLQKLEEAENYVGTLKEKSNKQKVEIEEKQNEAKKSLTQITESMTLSKTKKEQLNILNKSINEEKEKVEKHKKSVEEELKEVMPEVEKAQSLVKKIDSGALAEITVYFRKPILPQEVYYILKAMLQLIGYNDLSEYQVKQTFNMKAILSLQGFNIKKLSASNADKISNYVKSNPNCFNKSNVERINLNLAKISEFIKAVLKFYDVKLKIRPLEQALEEAEEKLDRSQKEVDKNTAEIESIEKKVKVYEETYAKLTGEAEILKRELKSTEDLLNKAESLFSKLKGEKHRWNQQIQELIINNTMLPFNSLLSSAFITFLGYYNESVREKIYKEWINAINSEKFKNNKNNIKPLINFSLKESEMLKLKFDGLPTDTLSIENAIIIDNSIRTVLIIDPVSKATEWFKKTVSQKTSQFEVISLHDEKILTNIELAIRFGKTLLITDIDKIESFLVPLIRGDKFKRGPTNVLKLGEKVIEIHDKFKLYITTRDSSLEISNNVLCSMSVVNFTVTRSGLESILLGLTIDIEQPELEKQKNQLLEEQDKIKLELSEVEKKLLEELIHLEGNLLENQKLIVSLEQSKAKSMKSEEILNKSLEQSKEIEHKRDIYKELSKKATTIYILLQDLFKINPMYRFDLDNFMDLFKNTIQLESKNSFNSIEEKLQKYTNSLIQTSFVYYSRSLFKSDLLVFGLYYVKTIFDDNSEEYKQKWDFLLGNLDTSGSSGNPPSWLPEERKVFYNTLEKYFSNLAQIISDNEEWFKCDSPEEQFDLLGRSGANLSELDKVLMIQVIRPDRMESTLKNFISSMLNIDSIVPTPMTMNKYLEVNKDNKIPIMFLTTLGSDPSKDLEELAVKEVGRDNYIEIPLGSGDNDYIIKVIKDSSSKGQWVTLKNIHLAFSWLPTLEKEIKSLQKPHEKFRLFLTTESHPKFSPILLQSCIKYTFETPPGVKKNMERIYQQWSVDLLNNINQPNIYQALFSLAFIHAILQERRTYIPQGWSKFYEFSYSDLKVSTETMIEYLEKENSNSAWENVKGLIKGTYYGGRIDNDFDHKVMCTYIDKIFDKQNLETRGEYILDNKLLPVIISDRENDYINIIKKIPENDNPEMFGLPLNVDRSVQRYVSTQVLLKLNSLYSMSSDMQKLNKALWAEKLTPILNMWKSIYNESTIETMKSLAKKISSSDPMTLYIKSEANQLADLSNKVQSCLNDINNALNKNYIITSQIINNCQSLLKNIIPEEWSNIWDGPELPNSYLKSLGKKIKGMGNYIRNVGDDKLLQNCDINLSEFLHPEAFINALRQKTAREKKIPIDELEIVSEFSNSGSGEICAKIIGLFLQGSNFDGNKLVDISGNQSEIINMPKCIFRFVKGKPKNENEIDIPLYENLFREHFICTLGLKFTGKIEKIILKGIALCLDQ